MRSATLTLNDDDVETTEVALTLDPDEVGEAAGSRAVRIIGALNGGPLTTNTLVAVTVGAPADSAVEGTDYTEIGALELSIPANRTDGSVTFTLRPTNDATAEGEETISVSGDTAGLTVVPAELVLADNDAVSTRLALSLRPTSVSEGAAPTDVTVTGTLDAGARETETLVTLTVGAPADSAVSDTDYVAVSNRTLAIPANETRAETTFTLTPGRRRDCRGRGVDHGRRQHERPDGASDGADPVRQRHGIARGHAGGRSAFGAGGQP